MPRLSRASRLTISQCRSCRTCTHAHAHTTTRTRTHSTPPPTTHPTPTLAHPRTPTPPIEHVGSHAHTRTHTWTGTPTRRPHHMHGPRATVQPRSSRQTQYERCKAPLKWFFDVTFQKCASRRFPVSHFLLEPRHTREYLLLWLCGHPVGHVCM